MNHCKKVIVIAVALFLAGCAAGPTVADIDYGKIAQQYESMKREYKPVHFTKTGLKTPHSCGNNEICMSEDDYKQNVYDKEQMLKLLKIQQMDNQATVDAYNNMVDANKAKAMALQDKDVEVEQLRVSLHEERIRSAWSKWLERIGFFGGALVLKFIGSW